MSDENDANRKSVEFYLFWKWQYVARNKELADNYKKYLNKEISIDDFDKYKGYGVINSPVGLFRELFSKRYLDSSEILGKAINDERLFVDMTRSFQRWECIKILYSENCEDSREDQFGCMEYKKEFDIKVRLVDDFEIFINEMKYFYYEHSEKNSRFRHMDDAYYAVMARKIKNLTPYKTASGSRYNFQRAVGLWLWDEINANSDKLFINAKISKLVNGNLRNKLKNEKHIELMDDDDNEVDYYKWTELCIKELEVLPAPKKKSKQKQ